MTKKSVFQILKERQEERERLLTETGSPDAPGEHPSALSPGSEAPAAPRPERPPTSKPNRRRQRLSVLVSLGAIAPLPVSPSTSQQGVEDHA